MKLLNLFGKKQQQNMTLHEAIEKILKEAGKPLAPGVIADLVNNGSLYVRDDNTPVPPLQIEARIKKYPLRFTLTSEGLITLAENRKDSFNDIVLKVFDILRGTNVTDVNYFISSLFFYKRALDYPAMLNNYELEIAPPDESLSETQRFRSFYKLLKVELEKRGKKFDITVLDILFRDQHDHPGLRISAIDKALRTLENISLDKETYSVNEFGKKFSDLFKRSYVSVNKIGEFSTPNSLAELIVLLAGDKPGSVFYNPAGGYFSFSVELKRRSRNINTFYSEEINVRTFSLGLMNLMACGASIEHAFNVDSVSSSQIMDGSADVVISNPPFEGKYVYDDYERNYPFKSSSIVPYFLQLALRKAKPGGFIVMVVPESILYENSSGVFSFRKHLIGNHLVESVISLPSGVFEPYSRVKLSIIILQKDGNSKGILFFDADRSEYLTKKSKSELVLNSESVFNQYLKLRSNRESNSDIFKKTEFSKNPDSSVVMDNYVEYGPSLRSYNFADYKEVIVNDFNLEVKRYLYDEHDHQGSEIGEEGSVELSTFLNPFHAKGSAEENEDLKYYNISKLNSDFTRIKIEDSDKSSLSGKHRGRIIDKTTLLVGAIEGSLKPTIFEYNGRNILISNDVLAFVPDFNKVDPEYLVYELAGPGFQQQVRLFTQGVTIRRIKSKDFLRIRVYLPSLPEQRKIVRTKKEAFLLAKNQESLNLSSRLNIPADSEREIMGALKHELAPLASIMKGGIKSISRYLTSKIENEETVEFTEKISGAENSRTLGQLLSDLERSAEELTQLSENIQQIIDVNSQELKTEYVEIKKLIGGVVNNWEFRDKYNIVFHGESQSAPDVKASINRKQFSIFVRNFLENTHRHGYLNRYEPYDLSALTGPSRNLVFNAFKQEGSVIIEMKNDGDPFPEDFSFDDFVSFGGRGGSAKGTGIGGFLMKRIIQNHNGELLMLEPGESLDIQLTSKTHDNRVFPFRQIVVGVSLRIILPDKNLS